MEEARSAAVEQPKLPIINPTAQIEKNTIFITGADLLQSAPS